MTIRLTGVCRNAMNQQDEEISFLTVDQVIDLHQEGIRRYSQTESLAIRDGGLLESAVLAPQQTFDGKFLYESIAAMAAAYLIGLAFNHPFENGNKRVAFSTCSTFLRMNGFRLTLAQDEAVDLTLQIIAHQVERDDVVSLLDDSIELL
jgi:death-on-curing protein